MAKPRCLGFFRCNSRLCSYASSSLSADLVPGSLMPLVSLHHLRGTGRRGRVGALCRRIGYGGRCAGRSVSAAAGHASITSQWILGFLNQKRIRLGP